MTARAHKASYSRNKRNGGYNIRVEGPKANAFVGRTVPVTRRDGTENMERLTAILWTGMDEESGKPVALYEFEQQTREKTEAEF